MKPRLVIHAYILCSKEAEAQGSRVQGQPVTIIWPCQRKCVWRTFRENKQGANKKIGTI